MLNLKYINKHSFLDRLVKWKFHSSSLYYFGLFIPIILILWGCLAEGFLFTLDSQFTANYTLSNLDLGYDLLVVKYLLALLAHIFDPKFVQIAYFAFCLYIPAVLGFYYLKQHISKPAAFIAALFLILNPFTYERLVAGHLHVIFAVGLIIPFIHYLTKTGDSLGVDLSKPGRGRNLKIAAIIVSSTIVTPHSIWFLAIPIGLNLILGLRKKVFDFTPLFTLIIAAVLAYLIMVLKAEDRPGDLETLFFSTSVGSLFVFEGMWTEAEGNVASIFNWILLPIWVLLYAFFGYGWYQITNYKLQINKFYRLMVLSGLVGITIACLSVKEFEEVYGFLVKIPGFGVMREGHKWLGLYTIAFVCLFGLGVDNLINKFGKRLGIRTSLLAISCVLAVSVSYKIFFLAQGQIKVVRYPSAWEHLELSNTDNKTILVLPWSGYAEYDYLDGLYTADASGLYFSDRVISSRFPENMSYFSDCYIQDNGICINLESTSEEWNNFINSQNIGYILINKAQNSVYSPFEIKSILEPKLRYDYVFEDNTSIIFFLEQK